jgi:hypothetical protein
VAFGLVVGLLVVIVIVLRGHQTGTDKELKKYQAKVGRHVILPTDETPALASVTDPAKLSSNSFLKQGKKGDKVLIFAKWKRAIIYRPSEDRVVDIGPVDVEPPGGDTSGFNPLK